MMWGSGGSKSRLAKAAGAEPAGQMRNEELHAVVARSTFPSQNVQNTPGADHFWQLRCRKSARRCGAKHISKSKCTKHTMVGALLEVEMSKKCTFPSQNVQNTRGADHFWQLRCRKSARRCGAKHIWKSKGLKTLGVRTTFGGSDVEKVHAVVARSTTLHYMPQHYTPLHHTTGHYAILHSSTLHYTTLHSSTLHYTKLHYTTLHYTTLHYITLHYTTLHYTTLYYITLHYTPLHYITLYYTIFHYTSLPYTTLHSITLQLQLHNYTPLHSTKLHYTTLHYTTLHSATLQKHHTTLHYTTLH